MRWPETRTSPSRPTSAPRSWRCPCEVPDGGVLLAYAPRPDLAAGLGIAQEKIAQTALWAAVIGALAGLSVAALITARLRRITAAATEIEEGNFDAVIRPGFNDELGALGDSVDRMRLRLKESFSLLASERDRLHLLLERLREGVLTVNPGLEIEFANASARQMLGLEEGATGVPLPDPWPGVKLRALAAALFDPQAHVVEARATPDVDHIYSVAGIPALEADVAVIVITDVSERERRERAQREFVANAAHELRTPLSVISGAVEMLQAGAKEEPQQRDRFLAHIASESSRLGRLARALLLLARAETRAEALLVESLPVQPLLEHAAVEAQLRPGVVIDVDCPPDLAVQAQAELAAQIIANLVDNAAKLTERGRIVLRGRPAPGGRVAIEVSDTGPGIDPADQEGVFERFSRGSDRRDGEGFGLGLAIVRQAVRVLGGRVELESEPGVGTTVRVVLPAAEPWSSRDVSRRILLVDDEPGIVEFVTYGLAREGFEVVAVGDGQEALDRARSEPFDLMVLDVMLPRLSGTDVAARSPPGERPADRDADCARRGDRPRRRARVGRRRLRHEAVLDGRAR